MGGGEGRHILDVGFILILSQKSRGLVHEAPITGRSKPSREVAHTHLIPNKKAISIF